MSDPARQQGFAEPRNDPRPPDGGAAVTGPLRIVFATDGSTGSDAARRFLAALAWPPGTRIRVVTVISGESWSWPPWLQKMEEEWGRKTAEMAAAALLEGDGVEVTAEVRAGEPGPEILRAADECDAHLIALGSRGLTGSERFWLGSVARNVAAHAARPILVAQIPRQDLRQVVLAVDGSPHAEAAVTFAARLPLAAASRVLVCQVLKRLRHYLVLRHQYVPMPEEVTAAEEQQRRASAQAGIDAACARLKRAGKETTAVLREGDPATELLELAREQEADLIIAGTKGKSALEALLVGSVADRLLNNARCSLLLVPLPT